MTASKDEQAGQQGQENATRDEPRRRNEDTEMDQSIRGDCNAPEGGNAREGDHRVSRKKNRGRKGETKETNKRRNIQTSVINKQQGKRRREDEQMKQRREHKREAAEAEAQGNATQQSPIGNRKRRTEEGTPMKSEYQKKLTSRMN